MNIDQMLGHIATILFSVMIIPQIIKTYRTKEIKDVSVGTYILCLIANIIALIYASLIVQWPLIIKYIIGILETIIYLGLCGWIMYKQFLRRNLL